MTPLANLKTPRYSATPLKPAGSVTPLCAFPQIKKGLTLKNRKNLSSTPS